MTEDLSEEQVGIGCLFSEVQQLIPTRGFRILLDLLTWLLMAAGLTGMATLILGIQGCPRLNSPFPGLYLTMVVMGFVFRWTILKARLETRVYTDFLSFNYFPFNRMPRWLMLGMPRGLLGMKEIARFEATTYKPWRTGWGIHYAFSYGWVFNTSGNRGLAIETEKGKKILIGSQRAEEFYEAVKKAKGE
jgi:hypothetical protein